MTKSKPDTQKGQHSYLEPFSLYIYVFLHTYVFKIQTAALQPATDDTRDVNITHCHWLLEDAQQLNRSWQICYLFRSLRPQKTQCSVLVDLCPKVADLSTKKCYINVTERQKSSFRSAQTELSVSSEWWSVKTRIFYDSQMTTSEKIANSLTDQTKTNYYQLKEKSQLWRKELTPRYEITNRVLVIKGIKIM